jgi:hypothetical protein
MSGVKSGQDHSITIQPACQFKFIQPSKNTELSYQNVKVLHHLEKYFSEITNHTIRNRDKGHF